MSNSSPGTPVVAFRAGDLLFPLTERSSQDRTLSATARRDLERYYALLQRELPSLALKEASLLVEVVKGFTVTPETATFLWASVENAFKAYVAPEHAQTAKRLSTFLSKLSYAQCLALLDACERYWGRVADDRPESRSDRLLLVGLVTGE
jgi:hypothetical protein